MKRRRFKLGLFILLGALIVGIALYAQIWWGVWQLHQEAYQEFVESRAQPDLLIDSYEFITWGIKAGATEVEVNQVFSHAKLRVQGGEVRSTAWDGFVNIYEFNYGQPFQDVGSKSEDFWVQEVFWVFFDSKRRARKLRRHYFVKRGVTGSSIVDIDLENKTIN